MLRIQQGVDNLGFPVIAGVQQSDTIYAYVMTANTAQYVTPPTGANFVLFSASGGNDFYMKLGVSSGLSVPGSNITDGSAPELNPLVRQLGGASAFGLITTANCVITLAFYK